MPNTPGSERSVGSSPTLINISSGFCQAQDFLVFCHCVDHARASGLSEESVLAPTLIKILLLVADVLRLFLFLPLLRGGAGSGGGAEVHPSSPCNTVTVLFFHFVVLCSCFLT
jgi:hypothetical protein